MKAYVDVKKDKTEATINIVGGYEIKDALKARGYHYAPEEVLDYATTNVVNGWKRSIEFTGAKAEMAWLESHNVKCERGIVY